MEGEKKIVSKTKDDVPMDWIHEGLEYTHRLITNLRDNASMSFHITTYVPEFDREVIGDGTHEVVLYCLSGRSQQILEDGTIIDFKPGTATFLPREYRYRHVVGPEELVVAVCCNPPKQ